jgi:CRISPR-associated exonuclease Cas4
MIEKVNDVSFTFRVIDLKQYVYCPRILYYHTVLPQVRPVTYKMEAGIAAHQTAVEREERRSLRPYGLKTGERHFNIALHSPALALTGEVDMVIETERELIPVDYKNSRKVGSHFKLQLVAYGRLLASVWPDSGKVVKRGFLYLIPERKATVVSFTLGLQRQFDQALADLHAIAIRQQVPAPTSQKGKCVDCEFRRFCNDVL